ncbi:protein sidekick-2 [Nematostella vectensis]|uniref:protein sidekick-2 n=1 Tax=Nematostella vectensis TaxID=45351 RepID=UPI00207736D6|nr:protein sidekick-2 [Nematostella vectensis]
MKEFLLFVQIITIISLPKGEGAPKPVAFYPLNAVHNTRDISGNGLPAGIASGVTLVKGPDGRDGGAYYFSGTSSSYIEIPYHAMIDTRYSLTVLAWVRPESQGPILQYYRSNWGVHFWVVEPTPKLFVRVVTRSLQSTNNAMGGNLFWQAWYFVGFSYDYTSGRVKLFLDGVIVSELYIGTFETATNRELRLGAVTFDSRHYRGRISCLQIYNTALSWNDIRDASGACNDVPSAPPKNIRILAASTTSVNVTWEDVPLSERNGIILGFYLMFYFKTNTLLQTLHLAPNIRSRVFSGLEVHRQYSVKMFSYTVHGNGTISNMLSGYTGESVPVVAPYGLTGLSDSPYSVQLSWQFNGSDDRNVLGILRGFRVFYGDAKHPIPGDVRDGRVPDLWPFTVYNFRLAGYTTAGDGPKSDTITIRTQGTVPSASPENIRISAASPTSVNVTWEDVPLPNRNGIILGFYLMFYFKTNTLLQTLHLAPNIRSRVFSGLEVHRQYSVKMFSYTVHGNGTISNMLSGYTGESVPVVAPYGLTGLSDSPYSVQLSWQFNGSDDRNVLGILRGFRVFYGDAKHPIPGDVRDGRVPDLWPFTVYNFRLAGYTTAGDGPKSDTITIRTQGTVPSASPENIRISAASPTSVNVTWEDVPLPNRNGIILGFYLMFYFKTNTLLQTLHLAPNIRSRVFSGLEVHRQYSVKMFSYTVHGNGTISNMLSGYTGESELWPCFYYASIDELTQAANRIWYRLDGEPPRQIMTRSPKSCLGLCGWMKGTHPQRETGPVTRDLCFASGSGSCEHEALVTVRQCYGYFVYKFLGLPSGKLRISTEQGKHLDTPLEVLFHQRPGHHLTGHVFYQESPVLSPTQCVGYCLVSGERCKSFNYNSAQDNGICQLNNATATKYDQHISSNQEWGYYEPITVTFV